MHIPSLVGSTISPSHLLSDSFCVLNKQRLKSRGLFAICFAMCSSYGNLSWNQIKQCCMWHDWYYCLLALQITLFISFFFFGFLIFPQFSIPNRHSLLREPKLKQCEYLTLRGKNLNSVSALYELNFRGNRNYFSKSSDPSMQVLQSPLLP